MNGMLAVLVALGHRLLRNWPSKLAALLVALFFWTIVTSSSTSTTQRSFLVDLEVDGVEASTVAVGVPATVEVSVSGPSSRVDRLRADQLRATLDLSDAAADFERRIQVQTPADIRLLQVTPSDVIGFLEQVVRRAMPVEVALLGDPPPATELDSSAAPATVSVQGRSQVLDEVARVVALAPARGGDVELLALDALGHPVAEVTFEPASVNVTFTRSELLRTKVVPISFTPPPALTPQSVTLSAETVTLAGTPEALSAIESVPGTVDPPTGEQAGGRYTSSVHLTLPSGVVALTVPTATLQYGDSPVPQ